MNKKLALLTAGVLTSLLCVGILLYEFTPHALRFFGSSDMDLGAQVFGETPVHMNIRVYKQGKLLLSQYHAGAVTKLGMNMTLAKLTGDNTFYNLTTYNMNCTFISIGNQGTLNTDSTVLPGEWNRTAATVEDEAYNSFNLTCTIIPDAGGPYTADCIGINFEAGIGYDESLFAYDTFTEVTGIDATFTITVEFIVSLS